jgi:hypothetical protein
LLARSHKIKACQRTPSRFESEFEGLGYENGSFRVGV